MTATAVPAGARRGNRARREQAVLGWAFVLPLVALVIGLGIYPLIVGIRTSLVSLNYQANASGSFVGLRNYSDVVRDPLTHSAAWHTLAYLGLTLVVTIGASLVVALALRRPFRGRGAVLAALIVPWALPGVVSGLLWSRIYDPTNGLMNNVLYRLGIISHYHVWLASTPVALLMISLVLAWGTIPLVSLILLAGLQAIPDEVYEAASVDGARPWAQLRRITLPLLRPALTVALTIGTVLGLAIFDQIYTLTGQALSTRSIVMQVYTDFQQLDFSHAAALAFVLAAATAIFAVFYLGAFRRQPR